MSDVVQLRPMLGSLVLSPEELEEQEQMKVTGTLGSMFADQLEQQTGPLTVDPPAPKRRKRAPKAPAATDTVVPPATGEPELTGDVDVITDPLGLEDDDEVDDEDGDEDENLPPLIPNL